MSKPRRLAPEAALFLQQRFQRHYFENAPAAPGDVEERELALIQWEADGATTWNRHLTAANQADLGKLLASGPHSAYISAASYRRPWDAMERKHWLGARLGFDVDADALRAVRRAHPAPDLAGQLHAAKGAITRLVHDFLLGDLGIDDDSIRIVFSGGRGYHALIDDPRVRSCDGAARRDVCDLVTGTMDDPVRVLLLRTRGGWTDRIRPLVADLLEEHVATAGRHVARRWLSTIEGISRTDAFDFAQGFGPAAVNLLRSGGLQPAPHERRVLAAVLRAHVIPLAAGEPDAPVTMDVHRLFRLPGSLHGGTGLRCTTVPLAELPRFDPLRDAVAFGTDPVPIRGLADAEATLAGRTEHVRIGEDLDVPEAHAVLFLAQGQALPR